MTEETLAVYVRCRILNLIVKTLDLSLMAVHSQDEKKVTKDDSPQIAARGFDHLQLTRET
jgi:hypothetical protein